MTTTHINIEQIYNKLHEILKQIQQQFECPMTCQVMRNPVIFEDSNTYEKEQIDFWLENNSTSPKTNLPLKNKQARYLNLPLKNIIPQFMLIGPQLQKIKKYFEDQIQKLEKLISCNQTKYQELCLQIVKEKNQTIDLKIKLNIQTQYSNIQRQLKDKNKQIQQWKIKYQQQKQKNFKESKKLVQHVKLKLNQANTQKQHFQNQVIQSNIKFKNIQKQLLLSKNQKQNLYSQLNQQKNKIDILENKLIQSKEESQRVKHELILQKNKIKQLFNDLNGNKNQSQIWSFADKYRNQLIQTQNQLQNQKFKRNRMQLIIKQLIQENELLKQKINEIQKKSKNIIKQKNQIIQQNSNEQLYQMIVQSSSILKDKQIISNLLNFFAKKIKKASLFYTASKNNFSVQKFYQKYASFSNIIIICLTSKNKILGGYTQVKFNKQNFSGWLQDPTNTSFVFSLSNKQKFTLTNKQKAIYRYRDKRQITFGNQMLEISDKKYASEENGYCYLGDSHYENQNYGDNEESYLKMTGEKDRKFGIQEWEAFRVQFQ